FGWGITLMAVGGLSFVLPIFGRQFIVVSALGLSGMGSAMAGIVLFAIGVMLFNAAKKEEEAERERSSSNYTSTKPASTSPPPARSYTYKSIEKPASPERQRIEPHFTTAGGQSIDP